MEYRVGNAYLNLGDVTKGLVHHQAALAMREDLARDDPASAGNQVNVAESANAIGRAYYKLGKLPLARTNIVRGLGILEKLEVQGKLPPMYHGLLEQFRKEAAGGLVP